MIKGGSIPATVETQNASTLKYVFGKVHPLEKPCWLICITEMDQLMTVHKWVTSKLAQKYGMDPHLVPEIKAQTELGVLVNPVVLGAKWLATATKFLLDTGRVLVNPSGGIAPDVEDVTSEIEQDGYPRSEPIPGEIVYVAKWPDGKHYYLRSNQERLFPFDKLDSVTEARTMAARYAPGAEVKFVEPTRVYRREGD